MVKGYARRMAYVSLYGRGLFNISFVINRTLGARHKCMVFGVGAWFSSHSGMGWLGLWRGADRGTLRGFGSTLIRVIITTGTHTQAAITVGICYWRQAGPLPLTRVRGEGAEQISPWNLIVEVRVLLRLCFCM